MLYNPQAGAYRDRISIEEPTQVSVDTSGQPIYDWDFVCYLWANVRGITGTEKFIAPALVSVASHTVETRYRAGITPKMRIKLADGRILEIVSITNPDNGKKQLFFACKELV